MFASLVGYFPSQLMLGENRDDLIYGKLSFFNGLKVIVFSNLDRLNYREADKRFRMVFISKFDIILFLPLGIRKFLSLIFFYFFLVFKCLIIPNN